MLQAMWRKAKADIRGQSLAYFLILVMLIMATLVLTIALLVQRSANVPWDRAFAETNGPHVWLVSYRYDQDFSPVSEHEAVTADSGRIPVLLSNPLVINDEKHAVFLYGMGQPPVVARPAVASGRWLQDAAVDEIVLDFSMARYYNLQVGDSIDVLTSAGYRPLAVVGLAVTAHWLPYSEDTKDLAPAAAYISNQTLASIEPDQNVWLSVMGLRLHDPEQSREFVKEVNNLLGAQLQTTVEWQWLRELATFANQIHVLFLGFFSLLGLAAVGLIIANNIGGQVLAQYREIGLLKATGFKPSQITLLFLIEHLVIATLAVIIGLALGIAASPFFTSPIAGMLNTTPPPAFDLELIVTICLMIGGAVTLFTLIPAWHGGQINAVQAISVGFAPTHHHASRLAGLALWLRLPPVIILGLKDVFSRPLRTIVTIMGLLLAIQIAIFAVGSQATVAELSRNRVYFQGTPADMRVTRNFVSDEEIRQLLARHNEIDTYYSELTFYGWPSGHPDMPVVGRVLSDDVAAFDFQIQEGRLFAAPGEAVAGFGLMKLLNVEVGDEVTLLLDGRPLTVTIVGRHMEISNVGRVLLTGLDTYQQQIDPAGAPQSYGLALKAGAEAGELRAKLLEESAHQFAMQITNTEGNPSMMQLQAIVSSLAIVLLVIAAVNLLSTSLLGVRERIRDFGIQKTLGLTPGQIALSVMTGVIALTLIATLLGLPLGLFVYNSFMASVGEQIGAGAGFSRMNWYMLLLLLPGAILVAVISSVVPARRAARIEIADALHYE
jgi:putative ABC transport system permease protein